MKTNFKEALVNGAPIWVDAKSDFIPNYNINHLSEILDYPALNFPDKIAVTDGKTSFTYKELDNASNHLANKMMASGIKNDDRIIILSEKYCEVVIACVALWKIGAIYVPIEPESYFKRKAFFDSSLEPKAFIGNARLLENIIETKFSFDELKQLAQLPETTNPSLNLDFDNSGIAYIIHTSGSTGIPKGVCIQHEVVINYFYNNNSVLAFSEKSYSLSLAPFHFDLSIGDTIMAISTGASVYIYNGMPVGSVILNILEKERITHFIAVSTILTLITNNHTRLQNADLSSIEFVMTGAEVCDNSIINTWVKKLPGVRVLNAYGPTEVTVDCLYYTIEESDPHREIPYPIGKAMPNNSTLLVSDTGESITTPGVEGELLVGGNQLMKGYWKNETETNKVFVTIKGELYYKTGDICYLDEQNNFVYKGRKDNEIKLNGRRINLGEVKNSLLNNPKVINAAVGTITANNKTRLIAVLCLSGELYQNIDTTAFVKELQKDVPAYLMPEVIGFCDKPLVSLTGKIDEKKMIALLSDSINEKHEDGSPFFYLNNEIFTPFFKN